jgi:hypothetical protein
MKMNSREKVLSIILAAVIILLGGFKFLIEPEMKAISLQQVEYQDAKDNKMTADANAVRATTIDEENEKIKMKIDAAVAPFFPEIKSDKMLLFFVEIMNKSNVSYNTFSVTEPAQAQIMNPARETESITYFAKEAADEIDRIDRNLPQPTAVPDSADSSDNEGDATPKDTFEMSSVAIEFTGNIAQTKTLLDGIKSCGRIARVSNGSISIDQDGIATISLSVECFGVKKLTQIDPLLKDTLVK